MMPLQKQLFPPCPNRVRQMPTSFAWIDHRLRSRNYLQAFAPEELALYFFLTLAADDKGLSCWRLDVIEKNMPIFHVPLLREARESLVQKNLLAFKPWTTNDPDGVYQLLAVPNEPPKQQKNDLDALLENVFKRAF